MAGPDDRPGGHYKKGRHDFKRKNSYSTNHHNNKPGHGRGLSGSSGGGSWNHSSNGTQHHHHHHHGGGGHHYHGTPSSPGGSSSHGSSSLTSSPHPSEGRGNQHVSLNNFNGAEVSANLNKAWSSVLEKLHDGNLPVAEKPALYRSEEQPWSHRHGAAGAWGHRRGVMANGHDLLTELQWTTNAPSSRTKG
ncbi:hypothetical protein SYNPS1DRAFT_26871 [Syncephalis pseudoplumigaleata]|uniref:Uncharacterized protein n=1 Tax=Syncephalis pseudoplumigaleata TaxID=1712513 RepID=A0A4P9Z4G8_9FUNG|nr:hypothetical protein SYNPS1DRAFT_26871 [Syncephalis pseudoplumigaleata]|eukprot:RKP27474.1 hypothetical protein SYNPS1DRAFT_26871 [Syncephalis pseudoplumigaleata]